ncbi:hypothetical protein HaLaN_24297 [Haematococcus lacustris]|uniref:Uncharacterized protein n=1 Tax=Haematococcus lacustris TaxID=44745 RepID=A0A699ZUU0_HAELA|nr:hypothetical protein HaLaN_24297 [Haematococcus lacustris]
MQLATARRLLLELLELAVDNPERLAAREKTIGNALRPEDHNVVRSKPGIHAVGDGQRYRSPLTLRASANMMRHVCETRRCRNKDGLGATNMGNTNMYDVASLTWHKDGHDCTQ